MNDPGLPEAYDSNAFLASIISSSTDAILSKDLTGRITSWNAGAERIFGYTADEAIGQHVTLLFPPGRYDEEPKILDRIRRGEHVEHYETVRKRKDGTLIDVSLNVSPIIDATGRIVGASKVARDVTDVRRLNDRYRVTLESVGDGVIATEADGTINFMNVAAERLTGWSARESVGRLLDDVLRMVDDTTLLPVPSPVTAALRAGAPVRLRRHTLIVARDGSTAPVDDSAAPIRGPAGQVDGVVVIFRDVAMRRSAELAASRLAAIIEGSDDAIVSKDTQGIVTSWNPGAVRVFGYTADEMVGQSILKIIPPDRRHEEPEILKRFQSGERVDHFETVRMRKDGTLIEVSLTVSPIRDEDGRIVGASKIARDITAVREAQRTLERYARELEDRVRERTKRLEESVGDLEAFSYSLSHDLRAPLRAIRSFSEIVLEEHGAQLGEGAGYLERVLTAADRMDRLILELLALARLSNTSPELVTVDVDRVVRELVEERPELQTPRATVRVDHHLPAVHGHETLVLQAVANLLDNAVKYVAPGITPQVHVTGTKRDGRVRICIHDNGIGIEPAAQERMFQLFQRLATAETYQGIGIGLAIVRKAVERMDGSVGVESSPGTGSEFWIDLPAAHTS